MPVMIAESDRKKTGSSPHVKDLDNEKPWYFHLLQPSRLPYPPYNRILLPWPCGDLHDAHVG